MEVKKNLYHSEAATLGPIRVTVKTDVMPSKFKGKSPYVVLLIDGHERNYSCENEECQKALIGLKGRTIMMEATGGREDARIIVAGATAPQGGEPASQPAQPAPEHQNPPLTAPAHQNAPQAKPSVHQPVFGATAGMATVQAVGILKELGVDWTQPAAYKELHFIASNVARVSMMIERGELAETAKERQAAGGNAF